MNTKNPLTKKDKKSSTEKEDSGDEKTNKDDKTEETTDAKPKSENDDKIASIKPIGFSYISPQPITEDIVTTREVSEAPVSTTKYGFTYIPSTEDEEKVKKMPTPGPAPYIYGYKSNISPGEITSTDNSHSEVLSHDLSGTVITTTKLIKTTRITKPDGTTEEVVVEETAEDPELLRKLQDASRQNVHDAKMTFLSGSPTAETVVIGDSLTTNTQSWSASSQTVQTLSTKTSTIISNEQQAPFVKTETVKYNPEAVEDTKFSTTHVPIVQTETHTVAYDSEEDPSVLVGSQIISSKSRTVETVTYKTEKDGVVETRVEQKIIIQSGGDSIDHDKALAEAIQEATSMNPDMTVEKIEIQQQTINDNP